MQTEDQRRNEEQLFEAAKLESQQNHEIDKIAAKGMVDNANSQQL